MSTPDGTRTLREEMDARREAGDRFNLRTIVAMLVPFITELAERHGDGEEPLVHPGSIAFVPSGAHLLEDLAQEMPDDARDRACIAPEVRQGGARGPRASVFSLGAILYELVTAEPIGPGMRRPSEIAKGIPESFELLLGKALVGDAEARPADLPALAQALHQCSPMASIPPPAADNMLDDGDGFEVDVSLSMLPPAPTGGGPAIPAPGGVPQIDQGPTSGPVSGPVSSAGASKTEHLAGLKASLEADPRPRYIVIKDGMDHGPFTAVELLQQIATGSFREEHFLRDTLSQEERQIVDWEQFAPFGEHARLNRQVEGERKALKATVVKEQRSTQNKALIGGGIFLVLAAAFGGWWARTRSVDKVRIGVSMDQSQFIDFEGGLEGGDSKTPGTKGGTWTGGKRSSGSGSKSGSSGPPPQVAGGGSCESARAKYVEDYTKRGVPPDLGASAFSGLNRGTYLNSCGVPPSMSVSICAAVQNGRAVGVTVRTNPSNGGIAGCVRSAVFGMSFPAHPRMDIATTHFKAE
jgi:hypothetical protein